MSVRDWRCDQHIGIGRCVQPVGAAVVGKARPTGQRGGRPVEPVENRMPLPIRAKAWSGKAAVVGDGNTSMRDTTPLATSGTAKTPTAPDALSQEQDPSSGGTDHDLMAAPSRSPRAVTVLVAPTATQLGTSRHVSGVRTFPAASAATRPWTTPPLVDPIAPADQLPVPPELRRGDEVHRGRCNTHRVVVGRNDRAGLWRESVRLVVPHKHFRKSGVGVVEVQQHPQRVDELFRSPSPPRAEPTVFGLTRNPPVCGPEAGRCCRCPAFRRRVNPGIAQSPSGTRPKRAHDAWVAPPVELQIVQRAIELAVSGPAQVLCPPPPRHRLRRTAVRARWRCGQKCGVQIIVEVRVGFSQSNCWLQELAPSRDQNESAAQPADHHVSGR